MKNSCKLLWFLSAILLLVQSCTTRVGEQMAPIDYVNTLIGTNNNRAFSHGNTYPVVTHPFGMNFWTPQTAPTGDNWLYTYNSDSIRGFRQTHLPSPWIGDYGTFTLMPVCGKVAVTDRDRASSFSHAEEKATPYFYSVELQDYNIGAEMTATERCAHLRFNYKDEGARYLVFDANGGDASVKIVPEEGRIIGFCRNNSGGVPGNFANYFVIELNQPITSYGISNHGVVSAGVSSFEGQAVGAYVGFDQSVSTLEVRVSSSYISPEQAAVTLNRELGTRSFEQVKERSREIWNTLLSKVELDGGTPEQLKTFYSNFFRASLYPRKFYEVDEQEKPIYYSPYNGEVKPGYMYTDNGYWDTFRSAHPWLNLIAPSISAEIMQGLVNTYRDGGWLPSWASPGYRNSMIGSHAVSLLADAYNKGITDFDAATAFEAVMKDCFEEAPQPYMGRYGFKPYNDLGYIPYPEFSQSTSMSLEYAYDDYCISKLAKALNKPDSIVRFYEKRAFNYANSYDPSTRFMRPRCADGSWYEPFNGFLWGGPFTEGNAWQYTWSVMHDVAGLIELYGSPAAFVDKLDSVFTTSLQAPLYGRSFNEIPEMHNASFGQYAHGNQPAQHLPYLYSFAGQPWKTQRLTRKVMDRLYNHTPDGYCGDEDNGQTSSWYLFSALGFYPVCPTSGQYVLGTPLFESAKLHLENGKTVTLKAPGVDNGHFYVAERTVDGQPYTKLYLDHSLLTEGIELVVDMSNRPDKTFSPAPTDLPFSLSNK